MYNIQHSYMCVCVWVRLCVIDLSNYILLLSSDPDVLVYYSHSLLHLIPLLQLTRRICSYCNFSVPVITGMLILYCTVLYCTVLYCTALYCTALHCTALHCTAQYCTALHCTALYFTALNTALYCTALHCTVLYCTALH